MFALVEKEEDEVLEQEELIYSVVCEKKLTQKVVEQSKLSASAYKLVRNLKDKNQILMSKNLDFDLDISHKVEIISTKGWPRKRLPQKIKIQLENAEEHSKLIEMTSTNTAVLSDPKISKVIQFTSNRKHLVMQLINDHAKTAETDQYYLTGLDLYLQQEPCVMCAMALVHSRICRVFYKEYSISGGLGSRYNLHYEKSLNHHFNVWIRKLDNLNALIITRERHLDP
jgi:tRNA(Arg) A34 adenosine deaminase TadA